MTTKPHKAPKGKATASAIRNPLAPAAPPLPPPEGWKQQTAFGFMRFDDTPAGRLVRLADVLRWLESSKELPRAAALAALCDAMPVNVLQWCYQLHQTEYARPIPSDWMFGFQTAAQIDAAKARRENAARAKAMRTNWVTTWDGAQPRLPSLRITMARTLAAPPEPTEPGRPALLKFVGAWWNRAKLRSDSTCDVLDDPKATPPNSLAIRLDMAGELWGYGQATQSSAADAQPSTWPELVAYYKAHTGNGWKWTPERLALVLQEKNVRSARGDTGVMIALADELGVKRQALDGALRLERKRQPASVAGRVVSFCK